MVNVDFSPALVLGIFTMAGGALLYNNRLRRPRVSRDYDVTIASISVLVGGILVFQVWCSCMLVGYPDHHYLRCDDRNLVHSCRGGAWIHCCCLDSC